MMWWEESKDEVCAAVGEVIRLLDDHQGHRRVSNLSHLRLYGAAKTVGLDGKGYAESEEGSRLTLNIVQSVIDSSQALISTNRPRAQFLTVGGDYSLQRKAKKLTKFCDGQFSHLGVYDVDRRIFKDAAIFGTGFLKVFDDGENIRAERVFPD